MNMSELSDQDMEAIEEIHNRWIREELAGNNSEIIELCADDVKWMPPDAPPFAGKKTIAQYLSDNVVHLKNIQISDVVIYGSDSVAYLTSNYHTRFVIKEDSLTQEATGSHLWVLKKTTAGVWQVAIVTWTCWAGDQ